MGPQLKHCESAHVSGGKPICHKRGGGGRSGMFVLGVSSDGMAFSDTDTRHMADSTHVLISLQIVSRMGKYI